MKDNNFILKTSKGDFEIDHESRVMVFKSYIIRDFVVTTNYPKDWGMTRLMQHLLSFLGSHTSI